MSEDPMPKWRRRCRRWIGNTWLRAFGWRVEGTFPKIDKAVVIVAPHTSAWDFPHGLAVAYALDIDASWLGKHTLFRPPFGWFMRALGGHPVDRRSSHNLVEASVEVLRKSDRMLLALSPEGTRGRTVRWKTGFYFIAVGAEVPIVCAFVDFKRKCGGICGVVFPSGDVDADIKKIQNLYIGIEGKYPDKFGEIVAR